MIESRKINVLGLSLQVKLSCKAFYMKKLSQASEDHLYLSELIPPQ